MFARMLLATLAVAVAGVAGCAAPRPQASPHTTVANAKLPGSEACIWTINIQSWEVLDNQTLLVQAPMSKDLYLLKLFAPIQGLPFAERLAFIDRVRNGQICKDDELAAGGPIPERWPITSVRKLTPAEGDQLRSQYGKPVQHRQAPPAEGGKTGSGG
jgi:hypothetical protein